MEPAILPLTSMEEWCAKKSWLPRCNNLRVDLPPTYDFPPRFWRFSLPYYLQLEGRYQTVQFGPALAPLQDLRTVTQRQLRDALRAVRKEKELDAKPNLVAEARRYADTLSRNPELTKMQLADALGVSRIRVFQILSILKLPHAILEFILTHDSPEHKEILTERRLRPLTQLADAGAQVAGFRQLLHELGV